jgi:hypothetical protein
MPRIPSEFCRRMLLLAPTAAVLAPAVGASAADLTVDLKIERGQVPQNMRVIRVSQGDVVKLRWSTDQPLTLHLHGYDIEQTLERGAVAEMTFTARATGRFPVHVHDGTARAGSHSHQEAPLVLIEVYPQ